MPDIEVVADTGFVDFNSDVQGRIQNILTERFKNNSDIYHPVYSECLDRPQDVTIEVHNSSVGHNFDVGLYINLLHKG